MKDEGRACWEKMGKGAESGVEWERSGAEVYIR